jgi:hypothetical protein
MFLSADEIAVLTGRKVRSKQIEALRHMGVTFFINAIGRPIVAKSAIEGRPGSAVEKPPWRSNALGAKHGAKTN